MPHSYSPPGSLTVLELLVGRHLALINILNQAVGEGLRLVVQSVVLVGDLDRHSFFDF